MQETATVVTSPNACLLAGDVPHGAKQARRFSGAILSSGISHVVLFFAGLILWSLLPDIAPPSSPTKFDTPREIVWLDIPGPGGGGGGGGNRMPEPPRKAELEGKQKVVVPAEKTPKLEKPELKEVPKPEPTVNIPAVTAAAGLQ